MCEGKERASIPSNCRRIKEKNNAKNYIKTYMFLKQELKAQLDACYTYFHVGNQLFFATED